MKQILILIFCISQNVAKAQIVDSTFDFGECNDIMKEYDEFDQTTTYYTPLSKNCHLTKVIDKKKVTYYLSLNAEGSKLNSGEIGVKIILSNDQIISFPNERIKVDVPHNGSGWNYSTFITILPDKLQLFKKHKIMRWKLYIYSESQSDYEAEEFRKLVNCLAWVK